MSAHSELPVVEQDPQDPEFVQNPYPFYQRIRALGDFVFWKDYNMAMATTHVAVGSVMKSRKLGRQVPLGRRKPVPAGLEPFFELEQNSLLQLEPPTHTRLRRIAQKGFGRATLAMMAPTVSRITDGLIDRFPETPFDLIEAFAQPLPAAVITRFIGVPEEEAPRLQAWSNDMVAMYQARRDSEIEAAAAQAAKDFADYIRAAIADVRKGRSDGGFLAELVAAESEESMSEEELVSIAILLLNAGHEASVHTLGKAVAQLTGFADRDTALEPTSIEGTVEECLRYDPPLHLFTRYVYEDTDLLDHTFTRGQEVGCLLGSAGRDDAVWPDGEKFDPFRQRRNHIAFGSGIHVCIGASLARLEMQIALPALFSRCPDLRIVKPPRLADKYHFHGLENLMVAIR